MRVHLSDNCVASEHGGDDEDTRALERLATIESDARSLSLSQDISISNSVDFSHSAPDTKPSKLTEKEKLNTPIYKLEGIPDANE